MPTSRILIRSLGLRLSTLVKRPLFSTVPCSCLVSRHCQDSAFARTIVRIYRYSTKEFRHLSTHATPHETIYHVSNVFFRRLFKTNLTGNAIIPQVEVGWARTTHCTQLSASGMSRELALIIIVLSVRPPKRYPDLDSEKQYSSRSPPAPVRNKVTMPRTRPDSKQLHLSVAFMLRQIAPGFASTVKAVCSRS